MLTRRCRRSRGPLYGGGQEPLPRRAQSAYLRRSVLRSGVQRRLGGQFEATVRARRLKRRVRQWGRRRSALFEAQCPAAPLEAQGMMQSSETALCAHRACIEKNFADDFGSLRLRRADGPSSVYGRITVRGKDRGVPPPRGRSPDRPCVPWKRRRNRSTLRTRQCRRHGTRRGR